MFEIEILLIILAFIATVLAVISDIKTTEVPDYISYSLIFSALLIKLLFSLTTKNFTPMLEIMKTFPIIFLLAFLMYRLKQWGGGDVKLLFGLSIVFASYPSSLKEIFTPNLIFPFPLTIFINIIIIGVIYSIIYSMILAFNQRKKILKHTIGLIRKEKKKQRIVLISSLIMLTISFTTPTKEIPLFIAITIPLMFYLFTLIKSIEDICLVKHISTKKLIEGDWILEDIISKKVIIHKTMQDLTKEQIEKIQKTRIKKVLIKQGIVFTPVILIAVIASLIFGNLILIII